MFTWSKSTQPNHYLLKCYIAKYMMAVRRQSVKFADIVVLQFQFKINRTNFVATTVQSYFKCKQSCDTCNYIPLDIRRYVAGVNKDLVAYI
jgi:hypothetical protein